MQFSHSLLITPSLCAWGLEDELLARYDNFAFCLITVRSGLVLGFTGVAAYCLSRLKVISYKAESSARRRMEFLMWVSRV
jgi:hypothetical protein